MYLTAALPAPPEAFFSAIEHGRLHAGDDHQRMIEWQRMKAQGVKQGLADVIILGWNRFLAVELKVGRNTTSDAQDQFAAACRANNHPYVVCRSVVELDAALRQIGLPIPRSMQIAAMQHDAALSVSEPVKKSVRRDRFAFSGEEEAAKSAQRLEEFLDE